MPQIKRVYSSSTDLICVQAEGPSWVQTPVPVFSSWLYKARRDEGFASGYKTDLPLEVKFSVLCV